MIPIHPPMFNSENPQEKVEDAPCKLPFTKGEGHFVRGCVKLWGGGGGNKMVGLLNITQYLSKYLANKKKANDN